jgi:hypothetical protein
LLVHFQLIKDGNCPLFWKQRLFVNITELHWPL